MNELPRDDGLIIIVHVTTDSELTYQSMEKFKEFVTHKDLGSALETHARDRLPTEGFSELYSRYAKSLIGVGNSRGSDRDLGLETEFVSLANPYTDDLAAGMPVRLMYQGSPRANAQIEVFERKPDRAVTVSLVRTDESGIATIPVVDGNVYMLDAVVLRRHDPLVEGGAVWESLWANLTFAVPGTDPQIVTD